MSLWLSVPLSASPKLQQGHLVPSLDNLKFFIVLDSLCSNFHVQEYARLSLLQFWTVFIFLAYFRSIFCTHASQYSCRKHFFFPLFRAITGNKPPPSLSVPDQPVNTTGAQVGSKTRPWLLLMIGALAGHTFLSLEENFDPRNLWTNIRQESGSATGMLSA